MKKLGIYIHIPFCKQKCYYCDFFSLPCMEDRIFNYINSLKEEIKHTKNKEEYSISSIYIGGGTPSYIDSKYIIQILNEIKENFNIEKNAEITIEVNPGTVNEEKLLDFFNSGINRLSIGLQSDNDEILKEIGRIHNYNEFINTYKLARKIGFKNINIDLMIGLPNQTVELVEKTVNNIINLKPEHISVYSLILEEDTKLEKMVEEGELELPSEDTEREMYYIVREILKQNQYIQYEISNYSKIGYESKHNISCWNQEEYIGFGAGAHSYIDKKRYSNIENIENYIFNIENKKIDENYIVHEIQDKQSQMNEYIILGLRKINGINITAFKQKFNENPIYIYRNIFNKLVNMGLIEIDEDLIKLTIKGIDFANIVWEEFI